MKFTNPNVSGNGDPNDNPIRAKSNAKKDAAALKSGNYGPTQLPMMTHQHQGKTKLK